MAYRDYGEGHGGPGGGYEHRDRVGGEGGRGWMDRAREYVERARDVGRDVYERAQADRYGRGGPGQPGGAGGYDPNRYERGDYDRGSADRGPDFAGGGYGPGRGGSTPGGYEGGYGGGGYGGANVREGGAQGGYGGGFQDRDRDAGRDYGRGGVGGEPRGGGAGYGSYGGPSGGSYYGQGTAAGGYYGQGSSADQAYGGRPSHAGRGSKNYRRSDARIEEEVHEALMRHHEIDATDIDVRVENGEVTLAGAVEDRRTRRLAEEVVERLPGVRDVHNELRARSGVLGAIASAAKDVLDPARPTRDPDGTPGTSRNVTIGTPEGGTGLR